jgi:hypothetical protein
MSPTLKAVLRRAAGCARFAALDEAGCRAGLPDTTERGD